MLQLVGGGLVQATTCFVQNKNSLEFQLNRSISVTGNGNALWRRFRTNRTEWM